MTAVQWGTRELALRSAARREAVAARLRDRLGREPTEEELLAELVEPEAQNERERPAA